MFSLLRFSFSFFALTREANKEVVEAAGFIKVEAGENA
jgi:hypothetical protein